MKKKNESSDHNKQTRRPSIVLDYYCQIGNEKKWPLPQSFIQKICEELLEWAFKNPEAFHIRAFFRDRRIGKNTVAAWRAKWPEFADAYLEAKDAVGERRESCAAGIGHKKFDVTVWSRTQHKYDSDSHDLWRDDQAYLAKTKADNQDNERTIVVLKDYPDAIDTK